MKKENQYFTKARGGSPDPPLSAGLGRTSFAHNPAGAFRDLLRIGGVENSSLPQSPRSPHSSKEKNNMSTEANKATVRRYREIYNSNNLDALGEVLAADFVPHSLMPGVPNTLDGIKMVHQGTLAAFPDVHVTTEDLLADGDKVIERWSQTQTHTGVSLFGAPANSGRKVRTTGISIYRIANGKIAEHWAEMDFFGVMVQLGVIQPPGM
jgi:predicted ester cyclase